MKKIIAISPTLILFFGLLTGLLMTGLTHAVRNDLIAYSMVGLGLYCVGAVFVSSMILTVHGQKKLDLPNKLFFGYLLTILVLVILTAIFLMGHH
ncbi:MAG: LasU family protein [Lentilactobacillus hilgardii]|jgi:cytochrome c oxidase assembly factor CtaG|uniref:LasU family protein n=1 Tax=Lentilactobacillus hilgardii TaxID=1588 RepID=UPI001CC1E99B|nr:LasU family protein [Lentilactobacillus hilgardii]MBZ2200796.1 hypothetical protein [Lentilactobacillus hilgardii]MBZ2203795.1 hypothetical protein [Lentilactobacillus hilgardii]